MKRRAAIVGAAALAAAAAGAWWFRRTEAARDPAVERLWNSSFERPDGGAPLVMAALRGRPLVVNFWATWCPPCVKELPALDRFHREQGEGGWSVVALALDRAAAVREFLVRVPVAMPVGLMGLSGTDLIRDLGNAQGGLPFTVLIDARQRIVWRKLGETTQAEIERETQRATAS